MKDVIRLADSLTLLIKLVRVILSFKKFVRFKYKFFSSKVLFWCIICSKIRKKLENNRRKQIIENKRNEKIWRHVIKFINIWRIAVKFSVEFMVLIVIVVHLFLCINKIYNNIHILSSFFGILWLVIVPYSLIVCGINWRRTSLWNKYICMELKCIGKRQ